MIISEISSIVGSKLDTNAATAILANASLLDLLKNSNFISFSYKLFIIFTISLINIFRFFIFGFTYKPITILFNLD